MIQNDPNFKSFWTTKRDIQSGTAVSLSQKDVLKNLISRLIEKQIETFNL